MRSRFVHTGCRWSVALASSLFVAAASWAQDSDGSAGDERQRESPPAASSAPADQPAASPEQAPQVDRSNPRATMRSFLVAVREAAGEHPERIADAVECLDVSSLSEEDRTTAAGKLAVRLEKLIDVIGVVIEDLPVEHDQDTYIFYPESADQIDPAKPLVVEFERDPEGGLWRFSARTLASVSGLEQTLKQAADEKAEASQSAAEIIAARRTARATMQTFLEAMNAEPPRVADAVACLDSSEEDPKSWEVRGPTLADKLIFVMDRIDLVVVQEIPDKPDAPPFEWYTSPTGNIVIHKVPAGESKFQHEWRFTPQTLNTLDQLYKEFQHKPVVAELQTAGKRERVSWRLWLRSQVPAGLQRRFLALEQWQWMALCLLVVVGYILQRGVTTALTLVFGVLARKTAVALDRDARRRAFRPFGFVAMAALWYLALHLLDLPENWLRVLTPAFKFIFWVALIWLVYAMVDVVGGFITSRQDVRLTQIDDVLIPLVCKILKVVVTVLGILFIAEAYGLESTSVLTTLGIGGLAVAMAARDTIANLFGSITVLFDRPFRIGDWICVGDIDGTVERVGFRSTRVRTFYNSVISIPNSRLVDTHVDNYGQREYRRIKTHISVTYDTPPDKIEAFCEGIRELIRLQPYTRKDYYHVYLNQFASSSLDILLYTFVKVPDWSTELRERHRLFLDIIRLAERMDIEFAFPTQTLHMFRGQAGERAAVPEDAENAFNYGQDQAAELFNERYGEGPVLIPPVQIDSTPRSRARKAKEQARGDGKRT